MENDNEENNAACGVAMIGVVFLAAAPAACDVGSRQQPLNPRLNGDEVARSSSTLAAFETK
jgi:hypothetical protein